MRIIMGVPFSDTNKRRRLLNVFAFNVGMGAH